MYTATLVTKPCLLHLHHSHTEPQGSHYVCTKYGPIWHSEKTDLRGAWPPSSRILKAESRTKHCTGPRVELHRRQIKPAQSCPAGKRAGEETNWVTGSLPPASRSSVGAGGEPRTGRSAYSALLSTPNFRKQTRPDHVTTLRLSTNPPSP